MVRDSLGTILLSFLPIFVIISRAILSSFGKSRLQYFGGDGGIMSATRPKRTKIGDFSAQGWNLPKMHMPTC